MRLSRWTVVVGIVALAGASGVRTAWAAPRCEVLFADPELLCVGDCSGDRAVTVDEVLKGVHISLGQEPIDACHPFDVDRDDAVTVDEILRGVGAALTGCPRLPVVNRRECPEAEGNCNIAADAGVATPAYGKGAAFVDVDGDGWDDIWASDSDARSSGDFGLSTLYRNRGDGTFEPFDVGIDPDDLYLNWAASFADYDNDGDPDLLLLNGGFAGEGSLVLYRNDLRETGRFTRATEEAGIDAGIETWWGASWADYDLDGWLDFAVTPVIGRAAIFRNLGNGRFERIEIATLGIELPEREDLKNPVWLDFNLDGYPDLFVAGPWPALYQNEGNGRFRDVSALTSLGDLVPWPYVFAAATEDFNQDGWPDLYLGRFMLQDMILLNRGGTEFVALDRDAGLDMVVGPPASDKGFADPGWVENTMGLGVGDFNNDGMPDVFIGTGNPYFKYDDVVLCNVGQAAAGTAQFRRCSDPFVRGHGAKQTHGIALGDIDRDGVTDVFFNVGGMRVFRGEQPPNTRDPHALYVGAKRRDGGNTATVRLEGTVSNRDGIGARLRVEGAWQRHYVAQSTQGFQSQNSSWMRLALGASDKGTVSVTWPSGIECEARVWKDDRVIIREPRSGVRRRRSAIRLPGPRDAHAVAVPVPVDGSPVAVDFLRCEGH